jgi:hypothetical protein
LSEFLGESRSDQDQQESKQDNHSDTEGEADRDESDLPPGSSFLDVVGAVQRTDD